MARGSCLDCSRKHIAQAMVLLDDDASLSEPGIVSDFERHVAQAIILMVESRLGYPHHRWFACGHLAEAEGLLQKPEEQERLRVFRLAIMSGQAVRLEEWLTNPRRAMAVGHLAEAESEARREQPVLAATIRIDRLRLAAGQGEPNFDYLCRLACLYDGGPTADDLEQPAGNSKQFDEVTR